MPVVHGWSACRGDVPFQTCRSRDAAMPLILYQRDDCHLCDLALEVLAIARMPGFESVFIDGDDVLEARYGARVPVLRDDVTGSELDWPFDIGQARAWQEAQRA
jgi:hypothetical protein